ncbi:MAG: serine/threonine protein kinase [Polyangiaceae bacterium]|nr:serine/threonine protein kinase [Polyangiaceae bacterium]
MEARRRGRNLVSSIPPRGPETVAREGLVIADRYKLEERIGAGGMSSIWVANDLLSTGRVAVKVMVKPEMARHDLVERFRREAEVAKRLRGPHFVAILDHGDYQGTPFIVMQLLEGENLQQRLTRRSALDLDETGALLADLTAGLRVAHNGGVIHRDLKPANLYFAKLPERRSSNRDEVVKILDFGIARSDAFAGRLTAAGSIVGSLFYMSPEQARTDVELDSRSDLWQVGAVLYRCLTGRRAFEGAPGAVLQRLLREDVAPPSAVNPVLPRALDPFFAKALARRPEERFQTIGELYDAFRDVTRSVSGTRPAVRLTRQELPTLHGDSDYAGFARVSTTPSERPGPLKHPFDEDADLEELDDDEVPVDVVALRSSPPPRGSKPGIPKAGMSDPPTVLYTSLVPKANLTVSSPTPNTLPEYFSKDRIPSQRPSPWAVEARRTRLGKTDWWLFALLILALFGMAAAGVMSFVLG